MKSPKYLLLTVTALALPALADRAARRIAARGYTCWTGARPPRNPATLGVTWPQAILWTALAGALGGGARMASRRVLAPALPVEE